MSKKMVNFNIVEMKKLLGDDFPRLVTAFDVDNRQYLENAKCLANENKLLEMANQIHSVKGACANLGETELAGLCQAIESEGRKGIANNLDERLFVIEEKFNSLVDVLKEALD